MESVRQSLYDVLSKWVDFDPAEIVDEIWTTLGESMARYELEVESSSSYAYGKADGYATCYNMFSQLIERGYDWKPLHDALEEIAECPEPNSVEDCHDTMYDIAKAALANCKAT